MRTETRKLDHSDAAVRRRQWLSVKELCDQVSPRAAGMLRLRGAAIECLASVPASAGTNLQRALAFVSQLLLDVVQTACGGEGVPESVYTAWLNAGMQRGWSGLRWQAEHEGFVCEAACGPSHCWYATHRSK